MADFAIYASGCEFAGKSINPDCHRESSTFDCAASCSRTTECKAYVFTGSYCCLKSVEATTSFATIYSPYPECGIKIGM